jgi:hypothetical protein
MAFIPWATIEDSDQLSHLWGTNFREFPRILNQDFHEFKIIIKYGIIEHKCSVEN